MAGIGFELRRLFKGNGLLVNIRAFLYSSFITIGPVLMNMSMILFLQNILKHVGISYLDRELFLVSVMYCFIFSMIVTSGFSMFTSRYIADQIYEEKFDNIFPSLIGNVGICSLIGGVCFFAYFFHSPLTFGLRLTIYVFFVELIFLSLLMIYISVLKDYRRIAVGYLIGVTLSVVLGVIFLTFLEDNPIHLLFIAMDLGMLITILIFTWSIREYFPFPGKGYFEYLSYWKKYSSIFFTNVFYSIGLYIHNIMYWQIEGNRIVEDTFFYNPSYDYPSFYAALSIFPAIVLFTVKVETNYYEAYQKYYESIINGGNLREVQNAKENMNRTAFSELIYIMEIQLFFTILFMFGGMKILPVLGISGINLDTFITLLIGYYVTINLFVVMIFLLYHDDRKGALWVSFIFFIGNTGFTNFFILQGINFAGFGLLSGGFIALVVAIIRFWRFQKGIQYRVYCYQPIKIRKLEKKILK